MGTLDYGDNLDILRCYQSILATEVHVTELHARRTGTTIDAAEKNGRDWIGIDVTQLAISLNKNRRQGTYGRRLKFVSGTTTAGRDAFHRVPDSEPKDGDAVERVPTESIVRIIGEPTTPNEAATLAEEDKYQFQWWALGLVRLNPTQSN